LERGDIHRDRVGAVKQGIGGEGLSEDELCERTNQSLAFRNGDEQVRRDVAELRTGPARENLESSQLAGSHLDNRLKGRIQLVLLERVSKIGRIECHLSPGRNIRSSTP